MQFLRNHVCGFIEPSPQQVAEPIERRITSAKPWPERPPIRERIAPTVFLFAGMFAFVYGLIESEPLWVCTSVTLNIFALFLKRDAYRNRIDMQHHRDEIARAQGKSNNDTRN